VIAVVDYGVNNLKSVVRALAAAGQSATLSADADLIRRADRVLMPGVGNFGQASKNLRATGLDQAVQEVAASGRPVLGICLGMQLFFGRSDEAPEATGLGILPGRVSRFGTDLPVPHVGWAGVRATSPGSTHPVLAALFASGEQYFYHVHSYYPAEVPEPAVLAIGEYGAPFPTIVGRDNVLGVQFHPEKSQRVGIALLERFTQWTP
jgi:glutamine amidotransferase